MRKRLRLVVLSSKNNIHASKDLYILLSHNGFAGVNVNYLIEKISSDILIR